MVLCRKYSVMAREVQILLGENDYRTKAGNGHSEWFLDEPVDKGGGDTGPTPTEAVLGALGACVAITGRMYAKHKGWDLQNVQVNLRIEGSEPGGKPVIYKDVVLEGQLDEEQRHRILAVMGKCPVAKLLKMEVPIEEAPKGS